MNGQTLDQLDPRMLGIRLQDARRAAGLKPAVCSRRDEHGSDNHRCHRKRRSTDNASRTDQFAGLYRRPVSEFVGCQTITEGFVAQFRWTERQALEENSEYEASVFHLQQRAEDYVELRNRIHREFEGEFAELEIDLAQPLGGR